MKIGIMLDPYAKKHARYGDGKFEKIREHGFSAVDYGMQNTETQLYACGDSEIEALLLRERELADAAGVTVSQVHGPWRYPPRDSSEEERCERMERMKRAIRATRLLGSKYVVIHPIMPHGTGDIAIGMADETFRLNVEFFSELAEYAEGEGVTVCLENMPMLGFSIARPSDILRLRDAIGSDSIGVCLDTGHVNVFSDMKVGEEIRRIGDKLNVLHVHDNLGDKDAHLSPTLGAIDWEDVPRALSDIGFSGVFSLECSPSATLDDGEFEIESIRLYKMARKALGQ